MVLGAELGMELASARCWRPLVMAFSLVMGASGQLGDGGAPASFGDSCPFASALTESVGFSQRYVRVPSSTPLWRTLGDGLEDFRRRPKILECYSI